MPAVGAMDPSVDAGADTGKAHRGRPGVSVDQTEFGDTRPATDSNENVVPQRSWGEVIYPPRENTPQKGRPPPGGEEAEVVVYQPRGVGLMHTRHKPSDAHYTHARVGQRKYRAGNKLATTRKDYSHRHLS